MGGCPMTRPVSRVVHVIQNLNYGGMERLLVDFVRLADPARFESRILVLQYRGRFAGELQGTDALHSAPPQGPLSMLWPRTLARTLAELRPDVVHAHSGVWHKTALAARMARVPVVIYTEHGRPQPDPWQGRIWDRWASRRTDAVVAVSESVADQLRTRVVAHPDRVRVITNGVPTDVFAPRDQGSPLREYLGLGPEVPIIASIGRLEPVKGYEVMIEALAALRAGWRETDGPLPVLVLAGDGSQRPRLEALAQASGVQPWVRFLGWVDDVAMLHAGLTLFSLSSHSEGTSISLLEAMSAGCCPVVTDVGGNRAVLGADLTDCLVPAAAPAALAARWRELLGDVGRRSAIRQRARERVLSAFRVERTVDRYASLYTELLTARGRAPAPVPEAPPPPRIARRAAGKGLSICKIWDAEYPWDVRAEKIARALTESGHQVHLVARNRDGRVLQETLPEATVHRLAPLPWLGARGSALSMFPAFFNPRWGQFIFETARDTRADVVLCRDLPLAPTAIWAGRRLGIPVVLDMAENYPAMIRAVWDSDRHRWWDWLVRNPAAVARVEAWTLPRVQHILAVEEESRERLVQLGIPRQKVTIVSNTPPRVRAERPREIVAGDRPLHLVYLGLLEVPRGIGVLLGGVAQARQKGLPVRLSLIGTGRDLSIFQNQMRALGLDDGTVVFHGYLPNAEALRLVAQADVGVIPHYADESWNTTIPNKLFDYMAAGLPVLTSSTKPCARIVSTTGSGEVFQDRDESACATAIQRLADPELRRRYGAAGQQAILREYHWERDVARLTSALEAQVR